MSNTYEIRKDLPIPSRGGKNGLCATIRQMTCGDSIIIPVEQHLSVHTCARSVGAKVKTSSNKDGTVTVWLTSSSVAMEPTRAVTTQPIPLRDASVTIASPKIILTVADPALGLSAGYYANDDPYGSTLWIEGKSPELRATTASPAYPATGPGPVATELKSAVTSKQSIFD